jgi:SAM-dependent methyltransferase
MESTLLWKCPRCRGDMTKTATGLRCAKCGVDAKRRSERFVDFLGNEGDAATIAAWPDDLVRGLDAWAAGENALSRESLVAHGILKADGTTTPLGARVRYHLDEYRWQKGRKGLDGILDPSTLGQKIRILDVGCGAGQTLRRLELDRPAELYGFDIDPTALALGARLTHGEGIDLTVVAGAATALPFADDSFDLVLTRVALNYMNQRAALAEMTRVTRPGGKIFCRVECVWHDIGMLRSARGLKEIVCRLRDFGWATIHAVSGWQPTPGSTLKGGRAFASKGRVGRILKRHGCRVEHAAASPNGPVVFGRRTQIIVVASKNQEAVPKGA